MAINIQSRTDYSYLFSGFGNSRAGSGGVNLNFLSDYAAIKNGTYGKLMKAYFGESNAAVDSLTKNKTKVSDEDKKELAKVQSTADALKETADELMTVGSKSVFNKKDVITTDANGQKTTSKEYDTDKIYKAVSNFVDDYNALIKAVDDAGNEKVTNRAVSLANITDMNAKTLENIGITIEDDYSLSIDKDAFAKADMDKVKMLFNGTGSYGYRVSAQASLIDFAADSEASRNSTYTVNGTLNNNYSTGNLFNTYF